MVSAKLASAKYSLQFSVGAACTWGPLTVVEQHLSCQKQRWSPRGRPWPRGHILKSLASKPQVLGLSLGLEALDPQKMPSPRLEDSTIFEPLKF